MGIKLDLYCIRKSFHEYCLRGIVREQNIRNLLEHNLFLLLCPSTSLGGREIVIIIFFNIFDMYSSEEHASRFLKC